MYIKLRKGFDIKLEGEAIYTESSTVMVASYAVKPTDFHGITRPKLLVKEGDIVKAGSPVFLDKKAEKVIHTAPVSGTIETLVRGEKRKLLEIRIKADKEVSYLEFNTGDIEKLKRETVIETLCQSGLWTRIIQRPYGTIADIADIPKAIFISGFDSHPLAPNYSSILEKHNQEFKAGIDVLKHLCSEIHLSERHGDENSKAYIEATDVQKHVFKGMHPVGNVGVQIHHVLPINKDETVWTLTPTSVVLIGRLFMVGHYDTRQDIALTGDQLKNPTFVNLHVGANVTTLLSDNLKSQNVRVISGNILTGTSISHKDGYINSKHNYINSNHNMITVISEGNYQSLFGWILPTNKISFHRAFGLLSWLRGKDSKYKVDTNMNGQDRAFVMTGAFEKVVPMDVLPTYLIKAILCEDFDAMEQLGIYEVIEEDLALCEFIDVSKHDVQKILREGLELLQNS